MGLRYYLPENYENLQACEGFYIDNKAFFGTDEPDTEQWDSVLAHFTEKIHRFVPTLKQFIKWESCMGISRLILLKGHNVQVVLGDDERYVSIFVIIPENCLLSESAEHEFQNAHFAISNYLARKYPEKVFKRKNTWNLEPLSIKVRGEKGYDSFRKLVCG